MKLHYLLILFLGINTINATDQKKVALVFGVTGQDGRYLVELLLEKGYEVHGVIRYASTINTARIEHIINSSSDFHTHYGDITDGTNILQLINKIKPDEIYNLAAQSHVWISFREPLYTANVDGLGTLRILEAIRLTGLEKKTKYYQASTSELYGKVVETPQSETTPFYPRSPYAVAKQYAFWITVNYREAYGLFACNGILFNHESPYRGLAFVTRKITRAASRISLGLEKKLALGNLDSKRDWGHAKDYVEAMWLILQQEKPEDFVIATGETHSVREFVEKAFRHVGIEIAWRGVGVDEKGINKATGEIVVEINPEYFRPTEVDLLIGDATKSKTKLNWQPKYTFEALVEDMMINDLKIARDTQVI